jgi:P27 family predicted phage terminase small subunit
MSNKRGPNPKPTKLKELEGNPGKRPLNTREPAPENALPKCPSFIKGEARKEWNRLSGELFTLGLLTRIDRAALSAYCIAWGQLQEAEAELARMKKSYREMMVLKKKNPNIKINISNGMVSVTSNGNVIMEPMLSVRKQAMEQMHKFLTEFGMTPASRSRIVVDKSEHLDDALSEFIDYDSRKN